VPPIFAISAPNPAAVLMRAVEAMGHFAFSS
jgi:hypothetical protein